MNDKICSSCGIKKPLYEFNKDIKSHDGRTRRCIECNKIYLKKWRKNNPKYMTEYMKVWNKEHPEYIKQHNKKYYDSHTEERSNYNKQYQEDNKNLIFIQRRQYREDNKDKIAVGKKKHRQSAAGQAMDRRAHHKRLAHNLNAEATLTAEQWHKILKLQNNKCNLCGVKFTKNIPPTQDHIIPLSRGGGLTFENTQALCKPCNSRKHVNIDMNQLNGWQFILEKNKESGD